MQICRACQGSGYIEYCDARQEPCAHCKGNGQVEGQHMMSTDLTRQFPFYAILQTEDTFSGPGDPGKLPEGTILRVLGSMLGSYLVDIADGETDTQPRFWVLQSSVARLCDVCEESPATTQARYPEHAGYMLCSGCAAGEEDVHLAYCEDSELAQSQGSEPWHMEET